MKIFFYTLRPFDELDYCERFKQQYGIDYAWTTEAPNPGNLHLADGCDAVSTNPCEIRPEYLETFARGGVRYLPCRSIGYDHIPLNAARQLGLRVSHSHYPPEGVANYTIMLMLMATRKMNQIMLRAAAQGYSLQGKMGRDLSDCTVGVIGAGKNFVRTMWGLSDRVAAGELPQVTVVDDQEGRLTFTDQMAAAIFHLLDSGAPYGLYDMTGSGGVRTWADIARATFDAANGNGDKVVPVATEAYYASAKGPIAPRPEHSALDLSKLEAAGFRPRDWEEELAEYLESLRAELRA